MKFLATIALLGFVCSGDALKFSSGLHQQAPAVNPSIANPPTSPVPPTTVKPPNPSTTNPPTSPVPPSSVTTTTTVTVAPKPEPPK